MEPIVTPTAPDGAGKAHLDNSTSPACLCVTGSWTLTHYADLQRDVAALKASLPNDRAIAIDMTALGELDTAGAAMLAALLGAQRLSDWLKTQPPTQTLLQTSLQTPAHIPTQAPAQPGLPAARRALLQTVSGALLFRAESTPLPKESVIRSLLAHIGQTIETVARQQWMLLGFIGLTLVTLAQGLPRPRSWRLTPLAAQIEATGVNAIPIVALLTFMVGAVVAFLGSTVLTGFGAGIYTVNLVAFSFLREFGVLLTAILLAGRTASAFTAQIGSMQANEEIDAIRTLGLSPVELLVLPRVLALLLALPALTLVAMFSGLFGGALVCALTLDVSPTMFLNILRDNIAARHFLVGLAKAPVFAFMIAVIGCAEGFKVTGSAQSVGEHTTSSVVQSIFMVILIDALAALFCMQAGW